MQLPDDVLLIIHQYSKPVTRPDWRTCCPLSGHVLYTCLNSDLRVLRHTQIIWEYGYNFERHFSTRKCSTCHVNSTCRLPRSY